MVCSVCSIVCSCQLFCNAWMCCLVQVCISDVFSVVIMYLDHLSYVLCVLIVEGMSVVMMLCCL